MECGECTMCCELPEIKWLKKPVNVICKHCEIKKGCKIHDVIEDECSKFECAYYQMEKVNINFRPDKCKVIFEKFSDHIFFGTLHPEYELSLEVSKQIKNFGEQGFSTIIYSTFLKPALFLAEGHTEKKIKEEIQKIIANRK